MCILTIDAGVHRCYNDYSKGNEVKKMKEYRVCFTQYWYYTVTAEDEDEAIDLATEKFESEMYRPIARTDYDEVEAWENE